MSISSGWLIASPLLAPVITTTFPAMLLLMRTSILFAVTTSQDFAARDLGTSLLERLSGDRDSVYRVGPP